MPNSKESGLPKMPDSKENGLPKMPDRSKEDVLPKSKTGV